MIFLRGIWVKGIDLVDISLYIVSSKSYESDELI